MSKPMPMHGGPGMQPRKLDKKTLKRLLSYLKNYKGTIVLVTICILLSAVAGAASSMFLQTLIDIRQGSVAFAIYDGGDIVP